MYYDDEVIQLAERTLAVEWTAKTTVDAGDGCVIITQDEDQVVIPWCYVRDIIRAIEEAKDGARLQR